MTSTPTDLLQLRALSTARVLQATPEAVFEAIADPERLARWWGPEGFRNTFQRFEFRPDGLWTHTMHGPDGRDYANESRFTQIVPNQRVVIEHLCAPLFHLTITLAPQDGGTRIAWHQAFEDAETCARLAPICVPSNEQNLDRLSAVLAGRTP